MISKPDLLFFSKSMLYSSITEPINLLSKTRHVVEEERWRKVLSSAPSHAIFLCSVQPLLKLSLVSPSLELICKFDISSKGAFRPLILQAKIHRFLIPYAFWKRLHKRRTDPREVKK